MDTHIARKIEEYEELWRNGKVDRYLNFINWLESALQEIAIEGSKKGYESGWEDGRADLVREMRKYTHSKTEE